MKFDAAALLKTKVGSSPENSRIIAEAQRSARSVGPVGHTVSQQNPIPPLVPSKKVQRGGKVGVVVVITIIRVGKKLFDEDNFIAGTKPLRDVISTSLSLDDADPRLKWEYQQIVTCGPTGTIVKIDTLE